MYAAQNFVGVLKCVHVQSARRYQNINGHEKNRPNNNVSNQKESKRPIPFTVDIITLIFFRTVQTPQIWTHGPVVTPTIQLRVLHLQSCVM